MWDWNSAGWVPNPASRPSQAASSPRTSACPCSGLQKWPPSLEAPPIMLGCPRGLLWPTASDRSDMVSTLSLDLKKPFWLPCLLLSELSAGMGTRSSSPATVRGTVTPAPTPANCQLTSRLGNEATRDQQAPLHLIASVWPRPDKKEPPVEL